MADDWRMDLVERIRALILGAEEGIEEEAKWRKPSNPDGVPTFSSSGIICTLEVYKDKVKLTFAKGASLADAHGLFNASLEGGTRRAIDFLGPDELDDDALVDLVREAAAFNRG